MSKPTTYDDITRRTVPNLDTSFRPSLEQLRQAREGFRALDADEQALSDRVHAALAARGIDRVHVEIDRDRVTLRGEVGSAGLLSSIADTVRGLDGVGDVVDLLVLVP